MKSKYWIKVRGEAIPHKRISEELSQSKFREMLAEDRKMKNLKLEEGLPGFDIWFSWN